MKRMTFIEGSEATIGDEVRVQRGVHAGKAGLVKERLGIRLFVVAHPQASWDAFWIDDVDVVAGRWVEARLV